MSIRRTGINGIIGFIIGILPKGVERYGTRLSVCQEEAELSFDGLTYYSLSELDQATPCFQG
jgi:hypothetical protein